MRRTEELEQEIRTSSSPDVLSSEQFSLPKLAEYLVTLLQTHGLTVQDVVRICNFDRSYGYQLFNGTRRPTREFLLRLALALELEEAEAQRMLKIAGRTPLYARNRRDAAILYGLTHKLTAEKTNELLVSLDEKPLMTG